MSRVYDASSLKLIILFESLTGAKVRDCIMDPLTFIVEKGQMGLAIGKSGQTLKRVEQTLKKTIRLIEFDEDIAQFIRNAIYPLHKLTIIQNDRSILIKGDDTKTKALLIGRERSSLKKLNELVNRHFQIDEIVVQ